MKLTPSLYVQNLLAKLHPPITPTKRESQQLLQLLDTSFRKQLNAAYPLPQSSKGSVQNAESQADMGVGPVHATHQHMESILVHPLLQTANQSRHATAPLTKAAVDQFDAALADECNIIMVGQALAKYRMGLSKKEIPDPRYRLGPRISFWFSSLSTSEKVALISDRRLMFQIVPVMHADGVEEVVWEWLKVLYEATVKDTTLEARLAEDMLVSLLMGASIKEHSIQGAAQQFVQACKYRVESGRAQVRFEQSKTASALQYQPLVFSWKRLAAAILHSRFKHGIEHSLYDEVLSYHIPFSHTPIVSKSFLMIFHPSNPSADYLHEDIQSTAFVESFSAWIGSPKTETLRKALLVAVVDAAQLLLSQRKFEQSRQMLDFAEKQFPWNLPNLSKDISTADRLEHARQSFGPRLSFPYAMT